MNGCRTLSNDFVSIEMTMFWFFSHFVNMVSHIDWFIDVEAFL